MKRHKTFTVSLVIMPDKVWVLCSTRLSVATQCAEIAYPNESNFSCYLSDSLMSCLAYSNGQEGFTKTQYLKKTGVINYSWFLHKKKL